MSKIHRKRLRSFSDSIGKREVLNVWMEEYKLLSSDIMKRVELQQRNFALHNLFLSALAAYLFNYGITNGFGNLVTSEVLIFVVIGPIVSVIFTLRHINHDTNIIDKASYIQKCTIPNVAKLTGDTKLIGFEAFLTKIRKQRKGSLSILSLIGNDHTIVLAYALIYISSSLYIILFVGNYGGILEKSIEILTIICVILYCLVAYLAIATARRYENIGAAH